VPYVFLDFSRFAVLLKLLVVSLATRVLAVRFSQQGRGGLTTSVRLLFALSRGKPCRRRHVSDMRGDRSHHHTGTACSPAEKRKAVFSRYSVHDASYGSATSFRGESFRTFLPFRPVCSRRGPNVPPHSGLDYIKNSANAEC